jgi:hypothetical protein
MHNDWGLGRLGMGIGDWGLGPIPHINYYFNANNFIFYFIFFNEYYIFINFNPIKNKTIFPLFSN